MRKQEKVRYISIHAPREGRRRAELAKHAHMTYISIHAPREGGDVEFWFTFGSTFQFQSTPPARGATKNSDYSQADLDHFNPRPPRGGRLLSVHLVDVLLVISIHAPREGGDQTAYCPFFRAGISIHAPREGGDVRPRVIILENVEISIHAPREGGDNTGGVGNKGVETFQSTPPARGATNLTKGIA
mgnify:CR=1 FL=1